MNVGAVYDYDRQVWVEGGAEAKTLLTKQVKAELDLLLSDKGAKYAIGIGVNRNQRILECKALLFDLSL